MKLVRVYLTVTALHLLIFSLVYIFIPGARSVFVNEDQFLENLTAIYYFDTFLLGLTLWFKSQAKNGNKGYVAIPRIGLFCFLDEMSFGGRIFGFQSQVIYGKKIDGLHDLIDLAYNVLFKRIPALHYLNSPKIFLCGIFVLAVIVISLVIRRDRKYFISRILGLTRSFSPFFFLPFFVGCLVVSELIDLEIHSFLQHRFFFFVEELFEMNAALSLLFASLAIWWKPQISVTSSPEEKRLFSGVETTPSKFE